MRRLFLAALALLSMVARAGAVEFGWQTLGGGGIEYIVQVEPELIDSFRQEGFSSDVPAGLRDIRRIHIVVGSGQIAQPRRHDRSVGCPSGASCGWAVYDRAEPARAAGDVRPTAAERPRRIKMKPRQAARLRRRPCWTHPTRCRRCRFFKPGR